MIKYLIEGNNKNRMKHVLYSMEDEDSKESVTSINISNEVETGKNHSKLSNAKRCLIKICT